MSFLDFRVSRSLFCILAIITMVWECKACTFHNAQDAAACCEICNTDRSEAEDLIGAKMSKKKAPAKLSVQVTLFGGIAAKPTATGKQSKKRKAADSKLPEAEKSRQETLSFAKKASTGSSNDDGLACANTTKDEFSKLKSRTRIAMKKIFNIEKLRFLQPKAVKCALQRQSQLVVMATGGGKVRGDDVDTYEMDVICDRLSLLFSFFLAQSLCYQLPAVVLGGTTIVISPLIALMQDQVAALLERGIEAATITSANGERQNLDTMERLVGRSLRNRQKKAVQSFKHITILYVTPEQVQTNRFRDILSELNKKKRLSLFAVDEAHWYVRNC